MIAPKYAKAFDLIMEISYDDFKIYFVNDFGVLSESWLQNSDELLTP